MATDNANVNVNRAYQNAWIVYINGLEIPVSSVSVSYGVWQIPQAEIVMIPDATLQRLGAEDRVTVQVFYCDHWLRPEKPEFRLLFDGEIIGWSYVNVQRGRSMSFTAVDYIQVFTQLFFFFMSSVDDLATGALNETIGVTPNGVNTAGLGVLFPYSLFAQGLIPAPGNKETPLITRPIQYVTNIITGLTENLDHRSVPAANFFAPWVKRTGFDKRFVALPYLEVGDTGGAGIFPILRAVDAGWAVEAVAGLTSNIGTAGSIWQVFEQVLSTLMMELAMLPTPASVTVDADLTILGAGPSKPTAGVRNHLTSNFVKPQFLFGLPPTCNVFFPSQITQFGYQENYATQPTRMYVNDESWTSYLGINQSNSTDALNALTKAAIAVAHPEEVHLAMRASLENPKLNGKNVLVYPEEFFRGPVVDRRTMPKWFLFLNKAQNPENADKVAVVRDAEASEAERLAKAREILPGDSERNLYRKFAAYEYMKERYSRRTAGVNMAFNPYPIPGFPCAIFDRRSTKVDMFGYIMNVRHVLGSRAMQTDISMSYGRTFQEAFGLLRKSIDLENAVINRNRAEVNRTINETGQGPGSVNVATNMERVGPIAVGPAEPLREIRDTIQNFDRAENFYKSLLYRQKPKSADEISIEQQHALLVRIADEQEGIIIPSIQAPTASASDVQTYLNTKDASFQYHKIIQIQPPTGDAQNIQLSGIDASTRLTLINIIEKMRTGTATEAELSTIRTSQSNPDLVQQSSTVGLISAADPAITQRLNLLEESIQNSVTTTNLSENVDIVPKDAASLLFESFEASMIYNARPICTLDEYITFLGAEADPNYMLSKVEPGQSLTLDSTRAFPAVYYTRIRKYRAGPPPILANSNMSNATVMTGADGLYIVDLSADINLDVRAANVAATGAPTTSVQSVPDDFPQTASNWDVILEEYRKNVLTREGPGT